MLDQLIFLALSLGVGAFVGLFVAIVAGVADHYFGPEARS